MDKKFIVASASPRRKEILSHAGYDFAVIPSAADETLEKDIKPCEAVEILAKRKAQFVAKENIGAVVLGCDTVVALEDEILGKPKDEKEAFEMLEKLSGKTHCVYTGVYITDSQKSERFVCKTNVEFYPLSKESIESYIKTGEPMDKAGAYGIQGFGGALVKKIDGDYFSVVGLPIAQTARVLKNFGIDGKIKL